MIFAKWLKVVFIFLAGGALWLIYGSAGFWFWSWLFLALSLLWISTKRLGWFFIPSIGLAIFLLAAVAGLQLGYPAIWMIGVVAVSLTGWDLSEFESRLRGQAQDKTLDTLAYQHLKRTFIVIGLGALLAGGSTFLQFQLNFWVVFLLGLGITISLGWAFQKLLHPNNS